MQRETGIFKRVAWPIAWLLLGAVGGLLAALVLLARSEPPLRPWHRPVLGPDFGVRDGGDTFAEYLARESALFDKLAAAVSRREPGTAARVFDRYDPSSPSNAANHPRDWNRSYEFSTESPRGGVLLIHGLSDSPYSTRALGRVFHDQGFHAVGLRVPGHGTIPGALTAATWRDWRHAVRAAALHVAAAVGDDKPFWVVGYSNGAALALDYTLDAIDSEEDRIPTQLVFLSPAMVISRVASLARFKRRLAILPGLEKLAWNSNRPEFDPYKYSSFPVRAAEEIYKLTQQLGDRIEDLAADGGLDALPPVLVFQSVVDSTIPPAGVVDRLLSKLPRDRAQLVLFDINRNAPEGLFRNASHDSFLESLTAQGAPNFGLTVVTNVTKDSRAVVARTLEAGSDAWTETELGLEWPPMVYSLSHVAIPFPPDDPVYGSGEPADEQPGVVNIGGVAARGERGLLALPMDLLMRLRYNPFFPYLESRLAQEIARKP